MEDCSRAAVDAGSWQPDGVVELEPVAGTSSHSVVRDFGEQLSSRQPAELGTRQAAGGSLKPRKCCMVRCVVALGPPQLRRVFSVPCCMSLGERRIASALTLSSAAGSHVSEGAHRRWLVAVAVRAPVQAVHGLSEVTSGRHRRRDEAMVRFRVLELRCGLRRTPLLLITVPQLPVGTRARRCQRCTRLQPVADFAGSKRSCRAGLSTHSLRRRRVNLNAYTLLACLLAPTHHPSAAWRVRLISLQCCASIQL